MTWTNYSLRASTEGALARSLRLLRVRDEDGSSSWSTSGPYHALDLGIPIVLVEAVLDLDCIGIKTPAVMSLQYHCNLALSDEHPDYEAIITKISKYVVEPETPQRVWA